MKKKSKLVDGWLFKLKGNNLQKSEKFSQNAVFFSLPIVITQKVLKLQISDGDHWTVKIISFPKMSI